MRLRPHALMLLFALTFVSCAKDPVPLADTEIAPWRRDLLELAYRGVCKFPLNPHIKNRSRAQEKVVAAAIELDQLEWAESNIPEIRNWRRGVAFADLAYRCVTKKVDGAIDRYLDLARKAGEGAKDEGAGQIWRRDRVLARVARVEALRGDSSLIDSKSASKMDKSAWRYLADVESRSIGAGDFDAAMASLDKVFEQGELDFVRHAHELCVNLYERFYADEAKRTALRTRVSKSYEKLPVDLRIDLMLRMARTSSEKGGKAEAVALIETCASFLEDSWLPEHEVPLRSRIAVEYHAAGQADKALESIAAAVALYEKRLEAIVNIYRAGCLRAIAEAYHFVGKRAEALAAYKRCAEAGIENPNSRPRADDFSATCISLAVQDCEPDEALRTRLVEICRGLGTPW